MPVWVRAGVLMLALSPAPTAEMVETAPEGSTCVTLQEFWSTLCEVQVSWEMPPIEVAAGLGVSVRDAGTMVTVVEVETVILLLSVQLSVKVVELVSAPELAVPEA